MSSEENKKLLDSVKDDITESVDDNKEQVLSYFIIGVFVAVLFLCVVFLGMQKTRLNKLVTLDTQINQEVTIPLKAMDNEVKQNETVLKQLNILTMMLSGREKYSTLIGDLRNNLFKKTLWDNLSVQKNTIAISGKVDKFEDIAEVTAGLKNVKAVKEIKLRSATLDKESGKINYSLSIAYDETLYKNTSKDSVSSSGQSPVPETTSLTSPVTYNPNLAK